MKKVNKIVAGLMALSVCFVSADFVTESNAPFVAVAESTTTISGTCGENLTYTLDNEGTLNN